MEIKFADSFWESLKTLRRHSTWWYKIYEIFRYNIPYFLKNVWRFKKELYKFRNWDSGYNLSLFKRSLELTLECIRNGHEIDETRLKKVAKIERTIYLLDCICKDNFIDLAEKELGKELSPYNLFDDTRITEQRDSDRKIFELARKLEQEFTDELFTILKGQDYTKFDSNKQWEDQFDGSGISGWWD